ncbi:MAG: HdeA/HdeB family chaperone [Desulfovibrionaceae bacterium]|nr:HdeA/HdeB family chaperone [Desulfovibrionaceae bacterium]
MKKIVVVCAVIGLLFAFSASAMAKGKKSENIQFGTLTCQEFLEGVAESDEESVGLILMWIDGYLSGVSGDTELNWNGFESMSTALAETCAKSPKKKVLDVAKAVGIE